MNVFEIMSQEPTCLDLYHNVVSSLDEVASEKGFVPTAFCYGYAYAKALMAAERYGMWWVYDATKPSMQTWFAERQGAENFSDLFTSMKL